MAISSSDGRLALQTIIAPADARRYNGYLKKCETKSNWVMRLKKVKWGQEEKSKANRQMFVLFIWSYIPKLSRDNRISTEFECLHRQIDEAPLLWLRSPRNNGPNNFCFATSRFSQPNNFEMLFLFILHKTKRSKSRHKYQMDDA